MKEKDYAQIRKEFRQRQSRQLLSIAVSLLLMLLLALLQKRPDLFGELPKNAVSGLQIIVIAAFIAFSVSNWKCPACNKYLGPDINKHLCKKCGTRLQ